MLLEHKNGLEAAENQRCAMQRQSGTRHYVLGTLGDGKGSASTLRRRSMSAVLRALSLPAWEQRKDGLKCAALI